MRRDLKGRDWLVTGLSAVAVVMTLYVAGKVINISADAAPAYSLLQTTSAE